MQTITISGTFSMVAHLAALSFPGTVDGVAGTIGVLLLAASLALFWATVGVNLGRPLSLAFSRDQPAHLVTVGPYKLVRHPFYLAYTLAWVGGTVATAQPALALTVV